MKGNGGKAGQVLAVSSLYKSLSSCSEHHAPELLEQLHISTAVDEAIVLHARSKKVVLVTGNPGDGKTHLIRKVHKDLPRSVTVLQDANELDNKALIEEIDTAIAEQRGLVLAINEGILLEICEQAKRRYPWAASLLSGVLRPYSYGAGPDASLGSVVILDLDLRNNLSPSIVSQAIQRVVSICQGAGELDGTAAYNLGRLKDVGVAERICQLLDCVGATGFHATMRDLLGFIAFLIFGDETVDGLDQRPYFLNAFEGGQGPLFDQVRHFDPLRSASPFLDDKLFMHEDEPGDWVAAYPAEMREREDLVSFQGVKRRAFFEHKDGLALLRPAHTDAEKVFRQLRQQTHAPEQTAVRLLNRFFDSREASSDRLILWKAHQFDARPIRFVATRQFVSADALVIRVPELPNFLRQTFPDHYGDHVVLCHRDMPVGEGLVIDRRLLAMLLAGDKYFGFGTRSLEAQLKVMSFYDRLGKYSANGQNIVEILRLENGSKVRIGVDLEDRKFYFPGGPL